MKPKAIIVDIDGTLADNDHRRHHVETPGQPKDWKAFFAAQGDDKPKKLVGKAVELLADYHNAQVIFLTGRAEEHRALTGNWLNQHFPFLQGPLFMRGAGDHQPDTGAKKHIYETAIAPKFNVILCVEDRASVVKLWRDLGLECWQVAAGDF